MSKAALDLLPVSPAPRTAKSAPAKKDAAQNNRFDDYVKSADSTAQDRTSSRAASESSKPARTRTREAADPSAPDRPASTNTNSATPDRPTTGGTEPTPDRPTTTGGTEPTPDRPTGTEEPETGDTDTASGELAADAQAVAAAMPVVQPVNAQPQAVAAASAGDNVEDAVSGIPVQPKARPPVQTLPLPQMPGTPDTSPEAAAQNGQVTQTASVAPQGGQATSAQAKAAAAIQAAADTDESADAPEAAIAALQEAVSKVQPKKAGSTDASKAGATPDALAAVGDHAQADGDAKVAAPANAASSSATPQISFADAIKTAAKTSASSKSDDAGAAAALTVDGDAAAQSKASVPGQSGNEQTVISQPHTGASNRTAGTFTLQNPAAQAAAAVVTLGVEMAAKFRKGSTQFDIRLDPPELGRVDVRMEVDRHGRVTSRLFVEKAETLSLLKADTRGLEMALEQAGLQADPGSLSFSLRGEGQGSTSSFAQQGQDFASAFRSSGEDDMPETKIVPVSYAAQGAASSGLDIRV